MSNTLEGLEMRYLAPFEPDVNADNNRKMLGDFIEVHKIKLLSHKTFASFVGKVGDVFIYYDFYDRYSSYYDTEQYVGEFAFVDTSGDNLRIVGIKVEQITKIDTLFKNLNEYNEKIAKENGISTPSLRDIDMFKATTLDDNSFQEMEKQQKEKINELIQQLVDEKKANELEAQKKEQERLARIAQLAQGILTYARLDIYDYHKVVFKNSSSIGWIFEFKNKLAILDDQIQLPSELPNQHDSEPLTWAKQNDWESWIIKYNWDCDITKPDGEKLELRFTPSITINNVKVRKNFLKNVFSFIKINPVADLKPYLEKLATLGVRKQKVVEMEDFILSNLGKDRKDLKVPISFNFIDKKTAEIVSLGQTIKADWEKVMDIFIYGNKIRYGNINIKNLWELGFDKKLTLHYLTQLLIEAGI